MRKSDENVKAVSSERDTQNLISRRTRAYGAGHERTAISNRAADLVRRYANGSSEQAMRNFERINRAYNSMLNKLNG